MTLLHYLDFFPMRRHPIVITLALVSSVLSGAACSVGGSTNNAAAPPAGGEAAPVPITVGRVISKTMPINLEAIGAVEPAMSVSVHAQITGQLNAVNFKEGDDVKAGAVLFTLDRRPFEADLKQAEANLQRDTAQAANAHVQAQRFADLSDRGIATREQVETARANAEALDGTLSADRAAVENTRIQLQYATITAPIAGRTGALMVHEGNLVRANDTTPLVIINQISPINVSFAIPEAQLPALKRSMARADVPVMVQPPGDNAEPSSGHVTFVDNTVDQTTGTIRVKGSFANGDHRLWPGQFLNVTLRMANDVDATVVPAAAVQSSENGTYVFVVNSSNVVEMRTVRVRRSIGDETIIADGVKPDEVVVTDGHLRLVAGSHVTVKDPAKVTP
jgi:multidrug efflux system membrane fusion protein